MKHIDKLTKEWNYLWLVQEKNIVVDIIFTIKEKINHTLNEEELSKLNKQLDAHEEILEYIKKCKLEVLKNFKS